MRIARLLIGVIVILVAGWIIVGEQMSGASANAVVNARISTVRADVAGRLSLPDRALGSLVTEGEAVASVSDPLADGVRLDDLRMERAFAEAEIQSAASLIEETKAIRESLMERTEIYREERMADLRTRLDHARTRLEMLEQGGAPDEAGQELADGFDTQSARVPFEPLRTDLALDHARERVELLEIAVRAAEQNVFLGDGYNDSPNAEQRAEELRSVLAGYEADHARAEARLAAVEQRLKREQVRVTRFGGGDLSSPVNGRYWEVLQADGVTVQRGDPILRLVDCDSTFVTLSVTERVYNTLRIGQPARFRMQGDGRVFEATVARLAGSGAETIYRNIAVAPSQRHLERHDVAILVPGLNDDAELGCAVGRTGRAFFDGRPLDGLRGLLN
ncbi:HlyD family efflux transporter periplasmic adaptor subunit [Roseivivax marinus]|uniref:HlyD family secretion protein n=1 Tax=Roseivivax marinus TaxID=1379903 RepID=UPI001F0487E3|nr:HlyD family efflux transporter periplasmic adaptor subunit [Roseivivax marinus]UMA64390.1 HlyD family efflux transporter periplasmic adaptor subunit [Roseivivax marinus]